MENNAYENSYSSLTLVLKDDGQSAKQKAKMTKIGNIIGLVLIYIFLAAFAVLMIFPFYWMIITSLKSGLEIKKEIPTFWPQIVRWDNYSQAFARLDFLTILKNTLIVGVFSTLGTLFTTIFAAFAFARLEFKGKEAIFSILLATMMIPGEMMVVSNYVSVSLLGMTGGGNALGAYAAMILPFMISVFYIYLLRQNFK